MEVEGRKTPEVDDGTLLKNVAQWDVDALRALYDRYGSMVSALARGILQDPELAQQATRETFLAIWRDALAFDPTPGNPHHWILSLVLHRSLALADRRRYGLEDLPETATHDAGVVEYAMRLAQDASIQRVLETLPVEQRTVLVLTYYGGYTQREIAERTGAPLEAVRIWLLNGVLRLCASLGTDKDRSDP